VARELGLNVPRDLSLISFDDTPIARFAVPPLTSVDQPIAATASRAVELIIEAQRGGGLPEEIVVIPAGLVRRQSTAPLNR
jgi:LacI family transcriptional regulator